MNGMIIVLIKYINSEFYAVFENITHYLGGYKMGLNMNQAYLEMLGEKNVSHRTFSDEEYLYVDNYGILRDEKGYNVEEWWEEAREKDTFKEGWFIVKD